VYNPSISRPVLRRKLNEVLLTNIIYCFPPVFKTHLFPVPDKFFFTIILQVVPQMSLLLCHRRTQQFDSTPRPGWRAPMPGFAEEHVVVLIVRIVIVPRTNIFSSKDVA